MAMTIERSEDKTTHIKIPTGNTTMFGEEKKVNTRKPKSTLAEKTAKELQKRYGR